MLKIVALALGLVVVACAPMKEYRIKPAALTPEQESRIAQCEYEVEMATVNMEPFMRGFKRRKFIDQCLRAKEYGG